MFTYLSMYLSPTSTTCLVDLRSQESLPLYPSYQQQAYLVDTYQAQSLLLTNADTGHKSLQKTDSQELKLASMLVLLLCSLR